MSTSRERPARAAQFFATTAKGMEGLLADELRAFGATEVAAARAGVAFGGALEVAYRAVLWSRVASRVLLPVATFPAPTPAALYDGVAAIRWADHIGRGRTLAVDCTLARSGIGHSHFAALKTKDAIVDHLRARRGERPDVDVARPDVRVNVHVHDDRAVVSIDLSGVSQHRRGQRLDHGAAPLRETVAAAVLLLARWPARAAVGDALLDPMCGAGTVLLEAAMIAADVAPGLGRQHVGCTGWAGHDPALWARLHAEAAERARRGRRRLPPIQGADVDGRVVRAARANLGRAGLLDRVVVERRPLAESRPVPNRDGRIDRGVMVTNPPYGERLGDIAALEPLYAELGDVLRRRFPGWTAYVLTGAPALAKRIGLRSAHRHVLYNGAIECRLLELPISSVPVRDEHGPRWRR